MKDRTDKSEVFDRIGQGSNLILRLFRIWSGRSSTPYDYEGCGTGPIILRPSEAETSGSEEEARRVLKRGFIFSVLYLMGIGLFIVVMWGLGVFRILGL